MLVVVVQLQSHVQLFMTPWTAAQQVSVSFIISQSFLRLKSIESVILSNHLILSLCQGFSSELALLIRLTKYWSFSLSISHSNEYSELISFRIDWFGLPTSTGIWRVFSNTAIQKHEFFSAQPSLWSISHMYTWLLEKPYLWLYGPLLTRNVSAF